MNLHWCTTNSVFLCHPQVWGGGVGDCDFWCFDGGQVPTVCSVDSLPLKVGLLFYMWVSKGYSARSWRSEWGLSLVLSYFIAAMKMTFIIEFCFEPVILFPPYPRSKKKCLNVFFSWGLVKTSQQVEKKFIADTGRMRCSFIWLESWGFLSQKRVLFCFSEAMFHYRMVLIKAGKTGGKFWRTEWEY